MPRDTPLFHTQALPTGDDGVRRAHVVIRCTAADCNAYEAIPSMSRGGALPAQLSTRKFAALGWDVGRKISEHLCPDCRPQRRKSERPILTIVQEQPVPATTPATTTVRELSFSDRRIINAKLEEVYENELVGYRTGWSDDRVAADLGVSLVWVEGLRSQNFGPSAGNAVVAELRAEQEELAKRMEAFRAEGEKLAKAITALGDRMAQAGLMQAA